MATEQTVVTAENLEAVRESLPPDQGTELVPGCITWRFPLERTAGYGTITVWENGRAAVCHNANSLWGDWHEGTRRVALDSGGECDDEGRTLVYYCAECGAQTGGLNVRCVFDHASRVYLGTEADAAEVRARYKSAQNRARSVAASRRRRNASRAP